MSAEASLYFRSLVVYPGAELRQEGFVPKTPFGKGAETPISAIVKELHVHTEDGKTIASLDNPMTGGPVVAICDGKETVLIPGERVIFDSNKITFIAQKCGYTQMVFLDGGSGDNSLFI